MLIRDLDGSLLGLGPDASILARAEFMHQTRSDPSEYTWYDPISRIYLAYISPYLPYISPTSRLYLAKSRLHLSCISPASPLHLP